MLEEFNPIFVKGDGNCLYRATSRALCGDENAHQLLRLKTALELNCNRKYYDTQMGTFVDLKDYSGPENIYLDQI